MSAVLASERISTKSPMSIGGFTDRYLRITHTDNTALRILLGLPKWAVLVAVWGVLIVWNVLAWTVFFWFTLAWRAYRNSRRREQRQALQHQELLIAIGRDRG